MLLPNPQSFFLVRERKLVREEKRLFLQNSRSFLLTRSVTVESITHVEVQESVTGLPPPTPSVDSSDSGRRIFLPSSHSFSWTRSVTVESVVQTEIQDGIEESATRFPLAPLADSSDSDKPPIRDAHKRTFLKAAGVAGVSLVASLFLPKKAEAFIMGSSPTTGVVGVKNAANTRINPATEETLDEVLKTTDLSFDAGSLNVKVTSLPAGGSSFSDAGDVARSALVDAARHVQVDVLSSALPTSASTETTLQTISFGGFKFALRLATVGDIDYVGEAAIGSATSAAVWRIKRLDSTTGIVIQWAGTGVFDQIWDNRASLTYS